MQKTRAASRTDVAMWYVVAASPKLLGESDDTLRLWPPADAGNEDDRITCGAGNANWFRDCCGGVQDRLRSSMPVAHAMETAMNK